MSTRMIVSGFDPEGPFAGLFLPPVFRKRQKETRFKQEWKIPRALYDAMMGRGPRYQRGTIGHFQSGIATSSGGPSGNVVLNSHTFITFANNFVTSGIRFNTNGELYENDSENGLIQQDGEWWSEEPDVGIGSSYAARHLSAGKSGTYSAEAAPANDWVVISADREWNVFQGSSGTKECDATFEVGPQPMGPADDSGFIELTALFA